MAEVKEQLKKYMKPSEIVTFGIGLFGVALLTGLMPDYTATFFADFAFKGKGFDTAAMSNAISMVFLVAGIVGAVCELVIGYLVDRTRTKFGKVKPWVGFLDFFKRLDIFAIFGYTINRVSFGTA